MEPSASTMSSSCSSEAPSVEGVPPVARFHAREEGLVGLQSLSCTFQIGRRARRALGRRLLFRGTPAVGATST